MQNVHNRTEMTNNITVIGYALFCAYTGISFAVIMLQEALHKAQIDIPEKWLLLVAVGLITLGGICSYSIELKQTKTLYNRKDLFDSVCKSMLTGLGIGLITSGYISTNVWLALVLASAFYNNLVLAIVPRVIEKKAEDVFGLKREDKKK